ncbi:nucleotidyltransferase domain-containing protein [bacterium]|nr:nucleotidyltransferase domain-containing protein [bacterium]
MEKISEVLFGKTRRSILTLLLIHSTEEYYYRQIVEYVGMGQGTVLRELKKLSSASILTRRKDGRQIYYKANHNSPIFKELKSIIIKTTGLTDTIRDALQSLHISLAFIFGSYALGTETVESDVDVMIIGDVEYDEVISRLWKVGKTIERELNPVIYSLFDLKKKLNTSDHFIKQVLNSEKIYLFGGEDDLRRLIS